jgi:GTPase SAR1 family protein
MYYPGTDAFVIVFNASVSESLNYAASVLLPEIRTYIDEQAKVIMIILTKRL